LPYCVSRPVGFALSAAAVREEMTSLSSRGREAFLLPLASEALTCFFVRTQEHRPFPLSSSLLLRFSPVTEPPSSSSSLSSLVSNAGFCSLLFLCLSLQCPFFPEIVIATLASSIRRKRKLLFPPWAFFLLDAPFTLCLFVGSLALSLSSFSHLSPGLISEPHEPS